MPKVFRYFYTEDKPLKLDKNKVIEGIEIFKTGTWYNQKFGRKDIEKIIENFYLLKEKGLFTDVPVRMDHTRSAYDLVGYIAELYRDGNRLLADLEITEDEIYEKWQSTTLRGRSAEIGPFEANDGKIYEPVLWGLAWVDIPQVDNLKPRMAAIKDAELVDLNLKEIQEERMSKERVEKLEKEKLELQKKLDEANKVKIFKLEHDGKTLEFASEETKEAFEALVEKEGEAKGSIEMLKAAVDELKAFQAKTKEDERIAYVEELQKKGKVVPATFEKEKGYVLGLSDEQFKLYQEIKKDQPAIIKLGEEAGSQAQKGNKEDELKTLQKVRENIRTSGDKRELKAIDEKIAKLQKEGA